MLNFLKRLLSKKDRQLSLIDQTCLGWPDWFGPNPVELIQQEIKKLFQNQLEGTIVEQVQIVDLSKSLTQAYPSTLDENIMLVKRAGITVKFTAIVHPPNNPTEHLEGFFSWVAKNLDTNQHEDRFYLDLGSDRETACDHLLLRLLADND